MNQVTFLGNYSSELIVSGFDIREMIANHAWKLIHSRGYTLKGKDREIIAEILERCCFETMAPEVTKLKFKEGSCILVFGRDLGGNLHLRIPALWGNSNVGTRFEEDNIYPKPCFPMILGYGKTQKT